MPMKWLFWSSVAALAYTYAGYPAWLWLRSRVRQRPVKSADWLPSVTVAMVVRNEAATLEAKLQNILGLDYPAELLNAVVVSDGSTDATNEILQRSQGSRLKALIREQSQGKAAGLNDAIAGATGEIMLFTDARQKIESGALRVLAAQFADPAVGCASGELMLGDPDSGETARGMGLYWRMEKKIREMESASGSVVGATGAIYAARRNLIVPVPAGTILDDVYIPMHVVRQGFRVTFVPSAHAWDVADQGVDREFSRKVRTLTGNYQLVQLAPWLLGVSNPLWFEFVSHKLMRLLAPFALVAVLLSSVLIPQPAYRIAFALQIAFYGLSIIAMTRLLKGPLARVADAARTFVVLNTAAVVAFFKFVTGSRVAWGQVSR